MWTTSTKVLYKLI